MWMLSLVTMFRERGLKKRYDMSHSRDRLAAQREAAVERRAAHDVGADAQPVRVQVGIADPHLEVAGELRVRCYALKQLVTAGVRVFFYLEDKERTLDSPTDKLLMSVSGFASEVERETARQRTADAMSRQTVRPDDSKPVMWSV
jgi:hypothetical protein